MSASTRRSALRRGLHGLAWAQGVAIAVLAVLLLLLRGSETAPALAAPAGEASAQEGAAPVAAGPALLREPGATEPPEQVAPPPPAASSGAPAGTVLYGRVVDEDGEAIEDGVVWFSRPGEQKQVATVNLRRPGHSEFAIAGLPPGPLDYRTRVTGYREQHGSIDIPADVPRLRRDIVLQKSWNLTVRINTPDGQPLHLALRDQAKTRRGLFMLEVAALATPWQPAGDFPPTVHRELDYGVGRWQSATGIFARVREGEKQPEDVAGVLEIDKREPLWISAVLRHRLLASTRVEPGQQEVALTVSLDQVLQSLGSIRVRVVDGTTGAPVAKARVSFSDAQSGGIGEPTDEQGQIEIGDLRPGRLRMSMSAGSRRAPQGEVLLEPGQTLDLGDVTVVEYRPIQGRCEGVQGKAGDCRVTFAPLDPAPNPALRPRSSSSSVADDGTFTLSVPDGRYLVRAYGAGAVTTELDTRTLGEEPLVLHLGKEASMRFDVQSGGEQWELRVFDGSGHSLYHRTVLRDGWKFPLPFPLGDYRVELTDRHGKTQRRQIHLGAGGVDLRVP